MIDLNEQFPGTRFRPDDGDCECCGMPVYQHNWVCLDANGFVFKCSEMENE